MPRTNRSSLLLFDLVLPLALSLLFLLPSPVARADDLAGAPGRYGIIISGDGSTIAYTDSSDELYLAPVSGGSATDIASDIYNIMGLSNAGEVVYGNSSSEFYLYSPTTGTSYLLSGPGGLLSDTTTGIGPEFSPDGTALVGSNSSGTAALWMSPADWSTASPLTPVLLSASSFATSVSALNAGEWKVAGRTNSGSQAMVWAVNSSGTWTSTVQMADSVSADSFYISGDGSTVAGISGAFDTFRVWNADSGQSMVAMGLPAGYTNLQIYGINSSGSVVVGSLRLSSGYTEAAYWSGSGSSYTCYNLREVLEGKGVDLAASSTLYDVKGVSSDGSIMVGTGSLPGGYTTFIANVTTGGVISPEQLNQSLGAMGQVGPTVTGMGQLSMNRLGGAAGGQGMHLSIPSPGSGTSGTDGQRGLSSGDEMPGSLSLWVVGSVGANIELNGDDLGLHGGIGLTWERGEWRVGGGLFGDTRDLNTDYHGNQEIRALGPGAFVAYSPEGTGLEFRVAALWQTVDLDLERGYVNGAGYATSSGDTDASVFGLSGRAQWTKGVTDTLALTPFAEYTWQHTHIGSYAESDGPFPASFDSRNEDSNSLRAGLRADVALFDNISTWAWAAWDHRFESKSSGLGGTAAGLGAFSYSGAKIDQNWADAGVGARWDLTERLSANTSLGCALDCNDDTMSDVTATVGLSYHIW